MFSVKLDEKHNLLTIEFRSNFDVQQGKLLCERLEKELLKAKKGFIVITDLSSLDFFDSSSYEFIKKIMVICNLHGVSKIFRVIPDQVKDIGFNIMSIFHYSNDVKIFTCKSMEEAKYNVLLSADMTLTDRMFTVLNIIKIKIAVLVGHNDFRFFVLVCGFIILLILRQLFKAFGVSLGYLYITLIALSGFWFELKGGIIAALISTIIFSIEVNIFSSWFARGIVYKTILVRFFVYFLSGIVIGYQSRSERALRKKLEFLAVHDELTGLSNFRFSLATLKKEFERSKRHKKNLTIAIIDIDHFKSINDNYGHLVGNDSLKIFSGIIKKTLRETDISGRYGGDEFILIFPESASEQGMKILNRIKTLISGTKITSSFLMRKKFISMTFSAGLASFSEHNKTVNDLINAADKALYQAKEEGRNRIVALNNGKI